MMNKNTKTKTKTKMMRDPFNGSDKEETQFFGVVKMSGSLMVVLW